MPTRLTLIGSAPADAAQAHDRCFTRLYRPLHAVARRLAGGDRALADDLLHDAYVQFVLTRPDLAEIANVEAYLAVLIRNLHLARLRRKANQRAIHVSLENYDTVERALDQTSPPQLLAARDALWRIAGYACERKSAWKGASVLLLRFFHGLYPTEIDRLIGAAPRTASRLLSQARAEVRTALAAPETRPRWRLDTAPLGPWPPLTPTDPPEIVRRLQDAIFTTSAPPCPSRAAMRSWYAGAPVPLDVRTLAHVSSCRACLDAICGILRVSPVSGRTPFDPPDAPAGTDREVPAPLRRARRSVHDVREHEPTQLQISVNGLPVGVLAVAAAESRVSFAFRLDEPPAFAELHSEQDVRVLWLSVTSITEGGLVQRVRVDLTHGRSVSLAIDFSAAHPTISVEYLVPVQAVMPARAMERIEPPAARDESSPPPRTKRRWHWFDPPSWARLLPVAGLTLVALAVGVERWLPPREAAPDAATLVSRAAARETSSGPSPEHARHRTLELTARRAGAATAERIHRIDSWVDGATTRRAIRVFDGTGRLVAGEWTDAARRTTTLDLAAWDDLWRADLSAAFFRDRYMAIGPCTVTDTPAIVTVACERAPASGLLQRIYPTAFAQPTALPASRAELALRRSDLHAVRLAVTLRIDADDQTITLEERSRQDVAAADIHDAIFLPAASRPATTPAPGAPAAIATPSLEVRLIDAIDRLSGSGSLTVTRGPGNRLRVSGIVTTGDRRRAAVQAVAALDAPRLIDTDISTFAEAAARDRPFAAGDLPARVELREIPTGSPPIEEYLRNRLPPEADVEALVHDLSARVLMEASRAHEHALALEALRHRFADDAIASFDERGRAAWRALVDRHAARCERSLDALDHALTPFFDVDAGAVPPAPGSLPAAIRQLAQDVSLADRMLVAAFTAADRVEDRATAPGAGGAVAALQRARSAVRALRSLANP